MIEPRTKMGRAYLHDLLADPDWATYPNDIRGDIVEIEQEAVRLALGDIAPSHRLERVWRDFDYLQRSLTPEYGLCRCGWVGLTDDFQKHTEVAG